MLSYAAVYGADHGVGHSRILVVVGDDGRDSVVFGDGNVADDLRDVIASGVEGSDPHERLRWVTRGLTYYTVVGPHDFEGVLGDIEPVARAHGL